ncbi:MAG: SH3 domain-containing protein [Anaerolineae bacterium]|nr:SH3 domain-containing protein [Anaerolineae bacterium]
MRFFAFVLVVVLVGAAPVLAQEMTCPALVTLLLENARESCPEIGLNEACYATGGVVVEPRPEVRLDFGDPGDSVSLAAITALETQPFDAAVGEWGMVGLKPRANRPDGGVNLWLFGEARLENRSDAPDDLISLAGEVTWNAGANLRANPDENADLVAALITGQRVQVVGRTTDGAWLRVVHGDLTGWVLVTLMRVEGDLNLLKVMTADDPLPESLYGPMQAFGLRTGQDDAPCREAPDSGLLAQSPTGGDAVLLEVNGGLISFNGTLWLQTTDIGETVVSVLEGAAFYGDGQRLEQGQAIQYGFTGDRIIYSAATDYRFYRARYLPLPLLPREFELPFSLGGLLTPFTTGVGYLSTIPADGACTVGWSVDINLRAGPGVEYPIRRGIGSGFYGLPDGRALGSDGQLWWRLADDVWLSSANTASGGDCSVETVPLVLAPPLPAA